MKEPRRKKKPAARRAQTAPRARRVLAVVRAHPVAGLVVVSFLLGSLWALRTHPVPFSDYQDYYALGRDIAEESRFGYPIPTARRLPGYPALLSVAMRVGRSAEWMALLNIALTVLLIPVVHRLAGALFDDRRVALAAAALCALNPTFVFFSPIVASEHLLVLLVLGSFLPLFGRGSVTWRRAAVSGGLAGLAVLTRGEALFYLPVAAFLGFARAPGPARRRLAAPAVLIAACAVVVSPWLVRNRLVMGPGVGLSTTGGVNFYFGHNATQYGYHDLSDTPIASDDEVEMQRRALRRGLAYLSQRPWRLAGDVATGTGELLWRRGSYAVRAALMKYDVTAERTVVIRKAFPRGALPLATWFYRAMLPLVIAGLLLARRIGRDRMVLLYGVVAMNWVCYAVVFWSKPRFRYTTEVVACVVAAFVAIRAWDAVSARATR